MSRLNAKNRKMLPFTPNSKAVFDVPLGGKIRRLDVILSGSIAVSAGSASGTVSGEGGPANLISRIYVNATPSGGSRYPGGKIVDADPRSLLRNAVTQRSGKFYVDQLATVLDGTTGTKYIYTVIPIYFADACQKNSLATALNTDADPATGQPVYGSLQVEVDTADLTACLTGNDRTVSWANLSIQIADDRVAVDGDTSVLYQESHTLLIPASNKRMLDQAMPRDGSFLSWQILAEQTTAYTLSDALLNRLVISGPTLDFDKYAQDIRHNDFADEWFDPATTATGMYFIDFTDGAVQANTVPAGGLDFYLDVNCVTGANQDDLNIFTRRIFAPQPSK